MHPVQRWIPRYIASCLGVREQEAHRIWEEITKWEESQGMHYHALCAYKPSILLPIAHILVISWPGRDCIVGFSFIARHYGIPSLDPITQLMNGLDPEYEEMLRKEDAEANKNLRRMGVSLERSELKHQRCLALWMAVETANDVLSQCSPSSSWERQLVYSTVKKAEQLLKSATEWRSCLMADTHIERELREIVRNFGRTQ